MANPIVPQTRALKLRALFWAVPAESRQLPESRDLREALVRYDGTWLRLGTLSDLEVDALAAALYARLPDAESMYAEPADVGQLQ